MSNPYQVSIVALDGSEAKDGQSSEEQGCLAEILSCDSALGGVGDDDESEGQAANGERRSKVDLQVQDLLAGKPLIKSDLALKIDSLTEKLFT